MTDQIADDRRSKSIFLGLAFGLVLLLLVGVGVLLFIGRERPLTDTQAAKLELTTRIEKIFAQKFSSSSDSVLVDLGDEDPIAQLADQHARELTVVVSASDDEAVALLSELAGIPKDWLSVEGGLLRVGAGFDVPFLGKLNAGVSQKVENSDGSLALEPEGFYLSGIRVPASELLNIPLVGDWVKQFTIPQRHCLADMVPETMRLSQLELSGKTLQLTFQGEDVSLKLSELQKTGVCS